MIFNNPTISNLHVGDLVSIKPGCTNAIDQCNKECKLFSSDMVDEWDPLPWPGVHTYEVESVSDDGKVALFGHILTDKNEKSYCEYFVYSNVNNIDSVYSTQPNSYMQSNLLNAFKVFYSEIDNKINELFDRKLLQWRTSYSWEMEQQWFEDYLRSGYRESKCFDGFVQPFYDDIKYYWFVESDNGELAWNPRKINPMCSDETIESVDSDIKSEVTEMLTRLYSGYREVIGVIDRSFILQTYSSYNGDFTPTDADYAKLKLGVNKLYDWIMDLFSTAINETSVAIHNKNINDEIKNHTRMIESYNSQIENLRRKIEEYNEKINILKTKLK